MATIEEYIPVGTRLRLEIELIDIRLVNGARVDTPIPYNTLSEVLLAVTKPDGTLMVNPTLEVPDTTSHEVYFVAAAGELNRPGPWSAQVTADGYIGKPVEFWVS